MELTDNKLIRVLLIEDNAGDARLIQEQLKDITELSFEVECVPQLQEGLTLLSRQAFDIVLSDLSLPDSPGLETFKRLQSEVTTVPVIVLTGFDNKSVALEAVREGAQDYLIKGQVEGKTLSRLILYAIERQRKQTSLQNMSLTDVLTGLYNRRGFVTLGEQALRTAHRAKQPLCLFFADLDGLKKINDTFGHPEGDQAIAHAAQILKQTFRDSDIVARLGGDEFAILAAPETAGDTGRIMERLKVNLKRHNEQAKSGYELSLSMGMAPFDPATTASVEDLLAKADTVLYVQKKERKGLPMSGRRKMGWVLLAVVMAGLGWETKQLYRASPVNVALPVAPPPSVSPVAAPLIPPVSPETKSVPLPSPIRKAIPSPAPKTAPVVPVETNAIPKDISIARFTYSQQILSPGARAGFDLIGSGFTEEFQKSLRVTVEAAGIRISGLRLVTANQIHGDIEAGPDATTGYRFPQVYIRGRKVFQAPQPFAVIRPGTVLDVVFGRLDEDGRGGQFRIYTSLDAAMAKQFRIKASAAGLAISPLTFALPYLIEGNLRLGDGIDHGDYDLIAILGTKEIYRKERMLHIVSPNLGETGLIQSLTAAERYHRPGDNVELFVEGTGFSPADIEALSARVDEINMGPMTCTFISPTRLGLYLTLPKDAPEGTYGILIEQRRQLLWRQKSVFSIVASNWLMHLQWSSVGPGEKGTLKITGRDFSADIGQTLRVTTDVPGIRFGAIRRMDPSTLAVDVTIDTTVRPGDYVVNLMLNGTPVKLPGGSLITVNP